MAAVNAEFPDDSKKLNTLKFPEVDRVVLERYKKCESQHVPISGPLIMREADRVAKRLNITTFRAIKGWLNRFQARHQIAHKIRSGEGVDVDKDVVRKWKETSLPEQLKGYDRKNIFNMDESAFFYRMLPTKALHFSKDDARGGKLAKQRVR